MAAEYKLISWNRTKIVYDCVLVGGIILYLGSYILVNAGIDLTTEKSPIESVIVRALGTCAFLMLTIVLSIGPLARLSPRFIPLLYNRRHFGVLTFFMAAFHAGAVILLYYGFADGNPIVEIFTENTNFRSFSDFPYQLLGVGALGILFIMAATSHDFWLKKITPEFWKAMHLLVYVAYAALVMHILIGAIQTHKPANYLLFAGASAIFVTSLHLFAGMREYRRDRGLIVETGNDEWLRVGKYSAIRDKRAIIVPLSNAERVAVFRDGEQFYAVSNVCPHQNGPLGEGKIVNGCIVCPWHGYEYDPASGKAPTPFTEKIATYAVKISGEDLLICTSANERNTCTS